MSNKWYIQNGSQGDIVLSSRVRLARNLKEYPFPCRLSVDGAEEVCQKVGAVLSGYDSAKMTAVKMADLTPNRAVSLAERHIISPEFTDTVPGKALVLSAEEDISVMLCEEDHIRIQAMRAGFALDEAYRAACQVDDFLDKRLTYAFDERLGYLTQCPTNIGTGMRASVMMHLPALARSWEISRLAATVEKLGLTIRGSYGEGSGAKGDIYQLSNRITLGISEKAAIDNLKSIALQLATRERAAREENEKNVAYSDKIHRAYGILTSARMLDSDEMMELLSFVRLGAVSGSIPVRVETVNELIALLQPATMNADYGEHMSSVERDTKRAEIIREKLAADAQSMGN